MCGLRDGVQWVAPTIIVDPHCQTIGVSAAQEISAALHVNAREIAKNPLSYPLWSPVRFGVLTHLPQEKSSGPMMALSSCACALDIAATSSSTTNRSTFPFPLHYGLARDSTPRTACALSSTTRSTTAMRHHAG